MVDHRQLALFLLFFAVASYIITADTLTTVTGSHFYSACTSTELVSPQVPNIAFAETSFYAVGNFSCNRTESLSPQTRSVTWHYHPSLPPPEDCCSTSTCYNTSVSIFVTNTYIRTVIDGNLVVTVTGNVISGPYNGFAIEGTIVSPKSDIDACLSSKGLEATSGATTLTIVGGPDCKGDQRSQYCPGLHFE